MKKLKFNSTLNHKQSDYKTREIIVEKVITLYGRSFSELKDHPLRDDPYIAENRDLMYIDVNDVAHCLLMIDYDSGDGILVESEGSNYARKSQFIPNASALVENSELTVSERKLHNSLKKIVDHIAEIAHCSEKNFVFEELLEKSDLDLKSLLRDSVVTMLQEREDIQMAESHTIDVDFQPDITVEAKPTQELTLYCPLRIVREYDESDYEFDEEVIIDEQEEIPSRYAVDCAREINDFIQNYSEPEEEHRGLIVYFDRNPAVSEKVFSAIPSVKEINGELMGVFECQITDELTGNELEDLRKHLSGQCSDGFFEGMEQHPINTADFGEICVKELSAPKGYALSTKVYELKANQTVTVYEDFQTGKIKINKTAEDKLVRNIEFKVTGSDGSSYTKKTNALGIAEFSGLKVYDMKTGKAITYTVTEINVAARYKTPKAQNVTLTKGNVDLTVNVNFDNDLKKGSIKINKQSEDNQVGDREFTIKFYNLNGYE